MIDSHIHLSHLENLDTALKVAKDAGVEKWLAVANDSQSWQDLIRLKRPDCHIGLGLHPLCVDAKWSENLETLERLILEYEPSAIAECGLDYAASAPNTAWQKLAFAQQAQWANTQNLPLSIHSYRAVDICCKILREAGRPKGVLHAFIGSEQQANRALDQGLLIGIGGAVSYPRAQRLRKLVQKLPNDAWVLETDAPYQPLLGAQGRPNPASALIRVAHCVAELRGCSFDEIKTHSTANALRLFPTLSCD